MIADEAVAAVDHHSSPVAATSIFPCFRIESARARVRRRRVRVGALRDCSRVVASGGLASCFLRRGRSRRRSALAAPTSAPRGAFDASALAPYDWRWRFMLLVEARDLVLRLMVRDLAATGANVEIDSGLCDPGDPGKFLIDRKPARAIYQRDGWYVPINRAWFAGSADPPRINDGWFNWYVLAIGETARRCAHYLICDFRQMREWVLDFTAPKGDDHRDHKPWRAGLRVLPGATNQAYFRWGDEDENDFTRPNRVVAHSSASKEPGKALEEGGERRGSLRAASRVSPPSGLRTIVTPVNGSAVGGDRPCHGASARRRVP
jgi:hypothetical protein